MDGLESVQEYEQPDTLATDPIELEPVEQEPVEQEPVAQTTVSSPTRKQLDPVEIDLLAQDLIDLSYTEATERLKKTYTENDWTDKELAAQKVSEVADILNHRDEVQPEFNIDTDIGTTELTMKLLSSAFDDDTKIKFIEDWRFKLKESLYNTDNADSLMFATAKEKVIDDYAMQLRRNIKAGDTGLIMDSLARGAEAALVPLADVTDLALGTSIGTKFREYALEHQNPERDSSISALFSSGAGSVVGFTASMSNPYTAFGYLGSTLISQGKQVYDEAYKATGSEEAAKSALLNSTPGIALGVFADRLIGGTLSRVLKGQKGFLGTLTGMSAGAVGMAAQSAGTGAALAAATGMEEYKPQLGQVAKEAAVGAALGGLVGGFADLTRTEVTFKSLNDQVRSVFKKNNAEGAPVKQGGEQPTNADEFLQQYVVQDGTATAEEPTVVAPTDGRAIPLTPEAVIASAADPLNADILFQNITELGVPEESAIGIQTLGAELTRLSREAMGIVRPRAGEEYEKYIKGEEETITAIEAVNPELAKKVKAGLDKWVQIQKEYAENPQKAAEAAAVHTRFEEMSAKVQEEAARLVKTYVRRPVEEAPETTGKESSVELDADVVDINAATVSGPTVLSAARAMPIRGPIPDAMKSNLQKVVPGMDYGYTPQPVTVALINRILNEITDPKNPLQIELANEGYMGPHMGFVDEKTHRLVIRREGFKDIERVRSTLAHELGHLLDNLARTDTVKNWIQTYPASVDEPVAIKLIRLGLPLDPMFSVDVILAEARDLSSQWRPGWEAAEPVPTPKPKNMTPEQERHYEYLRYRNNNNELKADVISAILNRPQFVQAGFPNIWKAFEAGLKQQPILKDFWNSIQDMNTNPNKLNEFVTTERQVGRLKQAKAKAKNAAEEILATKEEKRSLIRKLGQRLKDRLLNKRAVAREAINKITDENKKILAEELYGKTYAAAMADNYGAKFLNEQEITVFNKVQALKNEYPEGSNPNIDFKNILRSDHVLYDTTEEMHNIESDPASYRDAFNLVKKVVNGINPKSIVNQLDVTGLTGKALTDQIAKLHLYGDAKQRSDITNLIVTDPATGKPKKALTPEELKAIEILADGAFDARRYMGTGDTDPRTAEVEMALMKQRLGDNLFKKLRALVDEHHDVVFNYMWPRIKESQIFSPKLERRIELNRRSYSTMTAIKYFEKDPHITASVRKAVGNLNKIGDEWASTIAKSAMIGSRADHQISTNAAIELARMAGETMTVVYPKVTRTVDASGKSSIYVESLYKTQKEMQQENPQNSYLIGTDKGKSILYEIENPRWGQMFESSKLEEMPVLKAGLTLLEDFNRFGIEREIKTALSFPFYLRSKWYDHAQEALVAGSWEFPGLPFHTSKTLRELRRDAAEFERKLRRNEVDPEIQGLLDNYGLPFRMTQETGGYHDPHLKAENMIYEEMGVKIPTEEELDIPIKVNRFINKQLDKIGFGRLRRAVESDEVRAKIAMYLVGKRIKGYDDASAARIARELGGTPDPFGGGTEATAINKLFLFGRAHVNGMRALATIHQDNPTSFWTQYMYRKGIPRMLMSSAIVTPLIGALFGEEEERLYKKFLDKVPSFDKISKLCMPLGFVDPKGFFRGFNVNANEVNHDWKSAYLAFPLSRELVTTDTLMSPFFKNIEDYIETGAFSAKRIAKSAVEAFQSAFTGQLAPGIMSATRMAQFAGGGNPYDYYRNRGIFPKDIEEAGNFVDKSYRYFLWSLNQTAPGVFSFNRDRQTSTEPTTVWDSLANVPIAGATLRSFVRNSSYGDLEKYQELQQLKIERDADVRLKMKDETRKIYNSYRKGQAYVTRMGKDWQKFSDPEQIRRIHMLNNWHSRVYRHGFNGMRAAFENDDADALEREAQKLETASQYAAELLK